MTNKEAIRILGLECDEWDISHCTASERREAFEMAITALQELENARKDTKTHENTRKRTNNSTDGVKNVNDNSNNSINSKVKGMTACRVPEDDTISRRQAIDIFDDYNVSVENGELEAYSRDRKRLCDLPSVQPLVIHCTDCEDWLERQSISGFTISELPSAQPDLQPTCNELATDTISRQAAINTVVFECGEWTGLAKEISKQLRQMPSVQPEPLSDAYMKAVWTWLLDYQIKAAELKGRYTPYEVLSWVANDWRKEYEGSD